MPKPDYARLALARRAARALTAELFMSGLGPAAVRLVLEGGDGRDLGGLCREVVERCAARHVLAALGEQPPARPRRGTPVAKKTRYTVSDGRLSLVLEPAADGRYVVTSPRDPQLVTRAATLEEAFEMARDLAKLLRAARAGSKRAVLKKERP